jgi:hypothetical protein
VLQEGMMTSIREILQQRRRQNSSTREVVATIDNLKRLCIDHYFEEEIEGAMGACMDLIHSNDLFEATLAFRLMREAGHDVSAGQYISAAIDLRVLITTFSDSKEILLPIRIASMCVLQMMFSGGSPTTPASSSFL